MDHEKNDSAALCRMEEMISKLQYEKFGALHEFHTSRTAEFLEELVQFFGDDVLQAASEVEVDYEDLIRWHLKRTADLIEQLQKKFGPKVMELVLSKEKENRSKSGMELSQKSEGNAIEDIIPYFGGMQNVIEKSPDHCVIRTKHCTLASAAKDAYIENFVYQLHCCNDPHFVEGFNPDLGCEVRKSMLNGDEYCEHCIYIKK